MDPLTHVMAGALVGHACSGFAAEPAATLTAIAAAIIPDFDFYARKYQGAKFLKIHHGLSHSLLLPLFMSLVVAGPATFIFNLDIFSWGASSFGTLYAIALISQWSHLFLDWIMHNNGIPLLWPFTQRRFAAPLILGVNPNTVSRDCGNRKYTTCLGCQSRASLRNPVAWMVTILGALGFFTPEWRTAVGFLGVLLIVGYLSLVILLRNRAKSAIIRYAPDLKNADYFPARARPDRWLFIREFRNGSITALLTDSISQSILRQWQFTPPLVSPFVMEHASGILKDAHEVIKYPYPEVSFHSETTFVNIRDLSYLYSEPLEMGSIKVEIGSDGSILSEVYQEVW